MRAALWLILLAVILAIVGFLWVAIAAIKIVLWCVAFVLLIGAVGSARTRRT